MPSKIGFVSLFILVAANALGQAYPQQPAQQFPQGSPDYDQSVAQQGQAPDQIDPEDRNHGVGRISLMNGDVSVRRGDSGDQVAAAVNAPLLVQDSLVVGPASRAEVQFDTANRVRFANDTEMRISVLTADRFQVQIARGTLTWSVLGEGSLQGDIATPSVAIHALGRGAYRVSLLPDGTTQITVRSGTAEIATPRGIERISAGQTMLARGPVDNPEFQTTNAIGRDEWDIFNERRDSELQQSQSYNYVSRDIAGAEDLDNYGQWGTDPTYGQVWTPRVAADWSPYRLGRWSYEDYYGWTWVSSDPWGWAPYHYGSWFRGSYGWSWYPGARYSHYYYRPALVAFFGFGGGGLGLGFGGGWGFGNVGWVPLAPFERFNRWYGRGAAGYGGFGRTFNVASAYRNARVANGVASLSSRDFAAGHFGRYSTPGAGQLQQAGFARGGVPFTPTNNHFRFNDRQTSVQSRTNFNQTRFAAGNVQQRQNFQSEGSGSNWNRFGSPNQQPYRSAPSVGNSRSAAPQNFTGGNSSGWDRFGSPGASRQNFAAPSGQSGGYQRFSPGPNSYQRGSSQSVQVAPPVVRERQQQQPQRSYSQPSQSYSRPSFSSSQPRSESRPSAPQGSHQSSGHESSSSSHSSGGSHSRK